MHARRVSSPLSPTDKTLDRKGASAYPVNCQYNKDRMSFLTARGDTCPCIRQTNRPSAFGPACLSTNPACPHSDLSMTTRSTRRGWMSTRPCLAILSVPEPDIDSRQLAQGHIA